MPIDIDTVLISGKQGSGKSTTAKAVADAARASGKYYFIFPFKFAGPLYELQNMVLDRMQYYTGKPRVEKDGVLLQLLGTEWGRKNIHENVWVDALKKKIEDDVKGWNRSKILIIIDDCRFENEFDAFPDALRVRLEAPEETRKPRTESWRENTGHPSETSLDDYAARGRFDVVLWTDSPTLPPEGCALWIVEKLLKKGWQASRVKI